MHKVAEKFLKRSLGNSFVMATTTPLSFAACNPTSLKAFLKEFKCPNRTWIFYSGLEYKETQDRKNRKYTPDPQLFKVDDILQAMELGSKGLPIPTEELKRLFVAMEKGLQDREDGRHPPRNIPTGAYKPSPFKNQSRSLKEDDGILEYVSSGRRRYEKRSETMMNDGKVIDYVEKTKKRKESILNRIPKMRM